MLLQCCEMWEKHLLHLTPVWSALFNSNGLVCDPICRTRLSDSEHLDMLVLNLTNYHHVFGPRLQFTKLHLQTSYKAVLTAIKRPISIWQLWTNNVLLELWPIFNENTHFYHGKLGCFLKYLTRWAGVRLILGITHTGRYLVPHFACEAGYPWQLMSLAADVPDWWCPWQLMFLAAGIPSSLCLRQLIFLAADILGSWYPGSGCPWQLMFPKADILGSGCFWQLMFLAADIPGRNLKWSFNNSSIIC